MSQLLPPLEVFHFTGVRAHSCEAATPYLPTDQPLLSTRSQAALMSLLPVVYPTYKPAMVLLQEDWVQWDYALL